MGFNTTRAIIDYSIGANSNSEIIDIILTDADRNSPRSGVAHLNGICAFSELSVKINTVRFLSASNVVLYEIGMDHAQGQGMIKRGYSQTLSITGISATQLALAQQNKDRSICVIDKPTSITYMDLKYTNILSPSGTEGRINYVDQTGPRVEGKRIYQKYYYIKDHLGSTRLVVDSVGTPREVTGYHAYGTSYPLEIGVTEPVREKFTGKEHDEDGKTDFISQMKISARIEGYQTIGTRMLTVYFDDKSSVTQDFQVTPNSNDLLIASWHTFAEVKAVERIVLTMMDPSGSIVSRTIIYGAFAPALAYGKSLNLSIDGSFNEVFFSYNDVQCVDFVVSDLNDYMAVKGMGLDYFGSRYYDSEIGLWISPDQVEEFWDVYSYTGGNPINLIDPNGLSTCRDEFSGQVTEVRDDNDLTVYNWSQESATDIPIGETDYWDEFQVGAYIHQGESKDEYLKEMQQKEVVGSSAAIVAWKSFPKHVLDIKRTLGPNDGYLLKGKYMSGESIGNYFAGNNASVLRKDWLETIRAAGELHYFTNGRRTKLEGPWWGEVPYAGRQIEKGYWDEPLTK